MPSTRAARCFLLAGLPMISAGSVFAQTYPPNYDFDWATITDPGNAAYSGFGNFTSGRGSVPYTYRIAKEEITTAQWMGFVNTFSTRPGQAPPNFGIPTSWGAVVDPTYPGPGTRYRLANIPDAAMVPVPGIDWRTAARYCNWLCNNKALTFAATAHGAYDTSTFTINPNGRFNDQLVHTPGAPFWIPTLDEQLKAGYFDPSRYGVGQPGWWKYPDRSDTQLIPGPPGVGQTNAGFNLPGFAEWFIPLGAYASVRSPWGLLDVSGGTEEWNEDPNPALTTARGSRGSYLGCPIEALDRDSIQVTDFNYPLTTDFLGLRVASAIPAPGSLSLVLVWCCAACRRLRPRTCGPESLL